MLPKLGQIHFARQRGATTTSKVPQTAQCTLLGPHRSTIELPFLDELKKHLSEVPHTDEATAVEPQPYLFEALRVDRVLLVRWPNCDRLFSGRRSRNE